MKELAEAFKSFFEKISDFFDIFDLSFFISGLIASSAVAFGMYIYGFNILKINFSPLGYVYIAVIVYVFGLLCFSIGKILRSLLKFLDKHNIEYYVQEYLKAHNLSEDPLYKKYLTNDAGKMQLYVFFWARIRHNPVYAPTYSLLKYYWVRTAVYDGLMVAVILWSIVLFGWIYHFPIDIFAAKMACVVSSIFLLFASIACAMESFRHRKCQVEELIAAIAEVHDAKEHNSISIVPEPQRN